MYLCSSRIAGLIVTGDTMDGSGGEKDEELATSTAFLDKSSQSHPEGSLPKDEGAVTPSVSSSCLSMCLTHRMTRIWAIPGVVLALGIGACAAFLVLGLGSAQSETESSFQRFFELCVRDIQEAWSDYSQSGLWVHEEFQSGNVSRQHFRELYEHLVAEPSFGERLEVQGVSFVPRVEASERIKYENEAREFFKDYPTVNYTGFRGFEPTQYGNLTIQSRSEQPFYYAIHYIEPIVGNEAAIDLDLYSSATRRATINHALETWKPAVTERLKLVQETDPSAYSVYVH
jgi:CHASE1-domain containing sensor protein